LCPARIQLAALRGQFGLGGSIQRRDSGGVGRTQTGRRRYRAGLAVSPAQWRGAGAARTLAGVRVRRAACSAVRYRGLFVVAQTAAEAAALSAPLRPVNSKTSEI